MPTLLPYDSLTLAEPLHLAPEILLSIFQHLQDSPKTLYSASLVSKAWSEPALEALYCYLSVNSVADAQALTESGLHRFRPQSMIVAGNAEDTFKWKPVFGTLLDMCEGLKVLQLCSDLDRVPMHALERESLRDLESLEIMCGFDPPWVDDEFNSALDPHPSAHFPKLRSLVAGLTDEQHVPLRNLVSACMKTVPPILTSLDLRPLTRFYGYELEIFFPLAPSLETLHLPAFGNPLPFDSDTNREEPYPALIDLLKRTTSLRHLSLPFDIEPPQSDQLLDDIFQTDMQFQLRTLIVHFRTRNITRRALQRIELAATGTNSILGRLSNVRFPWLSKGELEAEEGWAQLEAILKRNETEVVTGTP